MKSPSPTETRALRLMRDLGASIRLRGSFVPPEGSELTEEDLKWKHGAELRVEDRHVKSMAKAGWVKRPADGEPFRITDAGISVVENIDPANFKPKTSNLTAEDIKDRLENWHNRKFGWLFYKEILLEERILDAYALNQWGVKRVVAYEIKVTREDFLSELRQPEKRSMGLKWSNIFYFILPSGIAVDSEIPPEAGFKELRPNGYIHTVRDAPWTEMERPSWAMVMHLINRYYEDRLDKQG